MSKQFPIGTKVKTAQGIRQSGEIISPIPKSQYSDGSYREPLTNEKARVLYVRWEDKTQGWTHKQFVQKI